MVKVKPTVFFVLILARCLQAAPTGDENKGRSKKASKVTEISEVSESLSESSVAASSLESDSDQSEIEDQELTKSNESNEVIPSIIKSLLKNSALLKTGVDMAMKSNLLPVPLKVAVLLGKLSWDAYNTFRGGAGITEVAQVSLESTIQS